MGPSAYGLGYHIYGKCFQCWTGKTKHILHNLSRKQATWKYGTVDGPPVDHHLCEGLEVEKMKEVEDKLMFFRDSNGGRSIQRAATPSRGRGVTARSLRPMSRSKIDCKEGL